ncbi:MAG TPA: hypothetical protein DHU75_03745 [Rikenellaceae bacterium]|nr:hypothetical protein [Rikenellaceae bacterium]
MRKLIFLDLGKYLKQVVQPIIIVTVLSLPLPIYLSGKIEAGWSNFLITGSIALFSVMILSYIIALDKVEKQHIKSLPVINKLFKTR